MLPVVDVDGLHKPVIQIIAEEAFAGGVETISNLSILKQGKAKAIRFSTLEAICWELSCKPGDLLDFEPATRQPGQPEAEIMI